MLSLSKQGLSKQGLSKHEPVGLRPQLPDFRQSWLRGIFR